MRSLKVLWCIAVISLFTMVCIGQYAVSDHSRVESATSENSKLVDEFGRLPHCDLTGRYDTFLAELSYASGAQGYVIVYQGADALPADYENPPVERLFRNHLNFRGFDPARVTVVNGGFQEEGKTQLWIVPPGAIPPSPESTIPKPEIPTNKTFLFDHGYLAIEEDDPVTSEYVLQTVKDELLAERERSEEEYRLERIRLGEEDLDVEEALEVEPDAEESDEGLTEEERISWKFNWLRESFGTLLSKRTESRGVIIYYADDQRFDVETIRGLIEEGIDRLSKSASLEGDRIEAVFGGYRSGTGVEFWVVPEGGNAPIPKPDERPVEEPSEDDSDY